MPAADASSKWRKIVSRVARIFKADAAPQGLGGEDAAVFTGSRPWLQAVVPAGLKTPNPRMKDCVTDRD